MSDKIHEQALERFALAVDADSKQREREQEDLRFQIPEKQWPDEVKQSRSAQSVNGLPIPARPMLSIPKLDQPIQLVLNQEKAAHLGVQVHALTEDADDDTAEVLEGLYRRIEVDSRANLARSWAYERAVKAGRGAYRILTEFDPSSPKGMNDQRIVIKRLLYQDAVYFDPFAEEPDWSDGEWAFVTSWLQVSKYQRLYPNSELAGFDEGQLVALAEDAPEWVKGDGEGRAVLVAEYFRIVGEGDARGVEWFKLNGVEILEQAEWMGKYIPIVPVIGRELIPVEGERRWTGIIGPNKDAQRLFNYAASAAAEMAALETKASHAVDPDSIAGYEEWWRQKNTRNFPYLPRRRFVNGQDLGPLEPIQADMGKVQVNLALLSSANEFISAGTHFFEPSLGKQSPNVKTKGATLALQQQSEQANSNWLDNLAEISMPYEAKVILDLIPYVYDRPGRIARILDLEDRSKTVMLNQPFVLQGQKPAAPQGAPGEDVLNYDLAKGRYGVTINVGKAYKSRVMEGKDELGMLFQAEPELFKLLGDLYLKFADFPGHREAAERMKKMLPPPLQDEDAQNDPKVQLEQAKAMMAQMQQQMQELEPERMKAQVQIQSAQAKAQADAQIAQLKTQADMEIARMDNATKIRIAEINATKEAVSDATRSQEERLALGIELTHDAVEAEKDRAHERAGRQYDAAMAAAGAAQDGREAAAGRQHDRAMSDAGHRQAMEQADQAASHASDAAVQQAALQPPSDGA
jgi:hypothetical protein